MLDRLAQTLKFYNGDVFEGDFENDDLRFGKYSYSKGDQYLGSLRAGKPSGEGMHISHLY